MSHGGHARHVLKELDVLCAGAEFIVPDQQTIGLTSELPVLLGVDFAIQARLGDLRCILKIAEEFLLFHAQDIHLDVFAKVGPVDQKLQRTPG
jgi:hypothetical protein